MTRSLAAAFVDAVAQHDRDALSALLAPETDFKGLTPGRFWEARSSDEVVDVVLGHWFADTDFIVAVTSIQHGDDVGDLHRVSYRFDITNDDGPSTVEQQAYYRASGERLTYLRVLCSGFRPRS